MLDKSRCPACFSPKSGEGPCQGCGFDPKTFSNTSILPPGTVLADRYAIGGLLGRGGFGATYRGYDTRLASLVAVKEYFLVEGISRDENHRSLSVSDAAREAFDFGRIKFLDEARTLAKLRSISRVVSVYDFFEENGTAYIIMDYLSGLTLKQLQHKHQGNRMPYPRALSIFHNTLRALSEIHRENILHSDLSPDNIFVCGSGGIKLIDFGSARNATSRKAEITGVFLKPGYAPVEQYSSDSSIQGIWSDIYSAGATFYHVLSGVKPPDSLERLKNDTLKPLSALGVVVAPAIEAAIMKALAVRPRDRWPTAQDFAEPFAMSGRAAEASVGSSSLPQSGTKSSPTRLSSSASAYAGSEAGDVKLPIALDELWDRLTAHQRFMERRQNGKRLNLARHDLSCLKFGAVNMSEAELSGTIFSCSDLFGANFSKSNLFCADFSGANLRYVRFDNCDLRGVRFDNADLTGSSLEGADCREGIILALDRPGALHDVGTDPANGATSFVTVNLSGAVLRKANLQAAQFTDSAMESADLSGANLQEASLLGARLANVKIEGANLKDCDFTNADLSGVDTSAPEFATATIIRRIQDIEQTLQEKITEHKKWVESVTKLGRRLILSDCDIAGLQMAQVDWSAAEFIAVNMGGINLVGATIPRTSFIRCFQRNANMADTDARGAKFVSCMLDGADFSRANLSPIVMSNGRKLSAIFEDSKLRKAMFRGSQCEYASFRGADLKDTDFSGALLNGADFSGANLDGVRFDSAVVDHTIGITRAVRTR